jgi:DNA-binding transcriptional MerR regulator
MVSPERSESVARRPGARPAKSAAAFRTISEVADELDVAQHVLRFWESKFPQVRPLKRGGGRRYYRPEDVDLLRQIRSLLYEEGYTIRGAQKHLKGQRRPALAAGAVVAVERPDVNAEMRERLFDLRAELVALRKVLRDVTG